RRAAAACTVVRIQADRRARRGLVDLHALGAARGEVRIVVAAVEPALAGRLELEARAGLLRGVLALRGLGLVVGLAHALVAGLARAARRLVERAGVLGVEARGHEGEGGDEGQDSMGHDGLRGPAAPWAVGPGRVPTSP